MSPDASGRLPQASAAVWVAFRLGEDVADGAAEWIAFRVGEDVADGAADVPTAAGADEDAWVLPAAALAIPPMMISATRAPSAVRTLWRRGHDFRGGRPRCPGVGRVCWPYGRSCW